MRVLTTMSETAIDGSWETVHLVADWYDGERLGVANYKGQPHLFESRWDLAKGFWEGEQGDDRYLYYYWLSPMNAENLESALHERLIWEYWDQDGSNVKLETDPELDEVETRRLELITRVVDDLKSGQLGAFKRIGRFSAHGVRWELP